jgi:hypothetical protein
MNTETTEFQQQLTKAAYSHLTLLSDQLDDLERVRIATANRLRSFTEPVEIASAGIVIDKGGAGTAEADALQAQLDAITLAEKSAVREIQRGMKRHPLADFVSGVKGIGEKTVARLLGSIGDPAWRYDMEAGEMVPRTLSQFWSYCGYGDAETQRRRKGVKSNWNAEARKRVHVIAAGTIKSRCVACAKQGKEREEGEGWIAPPKNCSCAEDGYRYRAIFDEARGHYDAEDITDAHKMNRALRKVKKEFLRDLWLEAGGGHGRIESQRHHALTSTPEAA